MKCPNCQEILVITERQGIEIDYCPKCRGVWLDRGELDKILDRSEQAAPGNIRSESDQYYRDDDYKRGKYSDPSYHHHRKKRGGFLGNLFDFD